MPRTFLVVLAAQFISSLADNAFLIVAIARTLEVSGNDWLVPILKISFTLFYVLLAPFVGPFADYLPKGRVMLLSNTIKVCAMLTLIAGVDPVLAIGIAGFGAAIYAPAKYGLITELLPSSDLVRANGYFEGVTVVAVILGTVLGGLLVSPFFQNASIPNWWLTIDAPSTAFKAGMLALLSLNLLAFVISLFVSTSGAVYSGHTAHPMRLIIRFYKENWILWRDPHGGVSMAITTLLWGVGATLQLLVLRWAEEQLGLPLNLAAYLQGITALGVIIGAVMAGQMVKLEQATRVLPLGVVIGCLTPSLLLVHSIFLAAVILIVLGMLAGFFVVPMNALLQQRGSELLTAGRSIAVQGFNENFGMLIMLATYAAFISFHVTLHSLVIGFGALVSIGVLLVIVYSIRIDVGRAPLCRT